MTVSVASLGFPRIGPKRELKMVLERFWSGKCDAATLLAETAQLRANRWAAQKNAGIDHIPSNDFSLYDHVLDASMMLGAVPKIYGWEGGDVPLATYFAVARGTHGAVADQGCANPAHNHAHGGDLPAAEMTKWFDTNYHFTVPELERGQRFSLASTKPIDEFLEARQLGVHTRPVLLSPVTWLLLGKSTDGVEPLSLLNDVLPVYVEVLKRLAAAGADWVQIDEPALVLDLNDQARAAMKQVYAAFAQAVPELKIMVATYFGALADNLDTALALPVAGLHLDLVRAPQQLDAALSKAPKDLVLSLGVIDGRNIWRADLEALLPRVEAAVKTGRQIMLAPSCSLLHTPVDLAQEAALDAEVKSWLAFATQKLDELVVLKRAVNDGRESVAAALKDAAQAAQSRRQSARTNNPAVRQRLSNAGANMAKRNDGFAQRREIQQKLLNLPLFPTTTIGSFPQTPEIRQARAAFGKGTIDAAQYEEFLKKETKEAVRWQEEIGLDVLVHGEFERNDMVQYFGEQLSGFTFTQLGWVQSYGSRCVRPPIIYGDVARPTAMTIAWWQYAQSLTKKPMKGMLTGPVTILQWSFVRDDQPRSETCRQIALAIRDEVCDLETAGAQIIQIDEAALREGLPLRRSEWQSYLDWAVECFRLTASGVGSATQIHTHMCYSEFNDIISAIGAMDADVISIETARSKMELLEAFASYAYPNEIGPGVYDIHTPRLPTTEEMEALLNTARKRLKPEQLWVNPDCGLKTRKWDEVKPALINMVEAARHVRKLVAA